MAFEKITEADKQGKGNYGQPDTPGLTTTDMQLQMDSLPNLAIDKHNELVDALNANKAATSLGAEVPTGISAQENVQSILNAYALNVSLNTSQRHTHSNKQVLDGISQELLNSYSRLVELFTDILNIVPSITNSTTSIPTAAAVKSFVDNYDLRSKIIEAAYPVGTVYCSQGADPTVLFGGTWTTIDTDAQNVVRYLRTN